MTRISFHYENPFRTRMGEEFLKRLPTEPGVYFFLDGEEQPLYIGKADCLRKRVRSYAAAKPGTVADHTLEMLELAESLRWEMHPTGADALKRENELIRVLRPPFNIAGKDLTPYPYIGTRVGETRAPGIVRMDFRLSHARLPAGFETYGCFPRRGKVKAGYTALLRLFYVATSFRGRLSLPSRICRSTPPYVYQGDIREEWVEPLDEYLKGESSALLRLLTRRMLELDQIEPHLYAPLQRDLHTAREFFAVGPAETGRIARAVGLRRHLVAQKRMDAFLREELRLEILAPSSRCHRAALFAHPLSRMRPNLEP